MKRVLFDLGETLFMTSAVTYKALSDTLEEFSLLPLDGASLQAKVGYTDKEICMAYLPENVDLCSFHKAYLRNELAAVASVGKMGSDIVEMLTDLAAAGFLLYVITDRSDKYLKTVLRDMKIESFFAGSICKKTEAARIRAVSELLETDDLAVFVGDMPSDILFSAKIHRPSIAVYYGFGEAEELSGATYVAENPDDVVNKVIQIDAYHSVMQELIINRQNRIIGINGVDVSGKTFFTSNLKKYLDTKEIPSVIIHLDDYRNPFAKRYHGEDDMEAYYYNGFNYKKLISEVLEPLSENGSLDTIICCLDFEADRYDIERHYKVDSDTILLIEGVLMFREPLIDYIEGRIFLQTDFDEVIFRATRRDQSDQRQEIVDLYNDKLIPAQKKYIRQYCPAEISDIIIENTYYRRPEVVIKKREII